MRVLVAGATGVIGRTLVAQLIEHGHDVIAMTRSSDRAGAARALGAEVAVADALDARAVTAAVRDARPDAVVNQLTSLPRRIDPRTIKRDFAANDRLRAEGTRILVDAAQQAGASRILSQSIAFVYAPGPPGTIHGESDPLFLDAPEPLTRTALAVAELERSTVEAGGLVLRYGYFYGRGSAIAPTGSMAEDLTRRRLPIVGRGEGVWSFIHVDDAARATLAALTQGAPGAYNVVDDDPARVADWLPALADALGAPRPLRVPVLLARLLAGSYGVAVMTRGQGASNARARSELGWAPRWGSWREGFREALG